MSLIFSTKTPVGKIENMTYAYVNITSLKTLTRNLVNKLVAASRPGRGTGWMGNRMLEGNLPGKG